MTSQEMTRQITINRYRLRVYNGLYAWQWAYTVVGPNGERSNRGRQPLASVRSWAKRTWPGSPVVETWKQSTPACKADMAQPKIQWQQVSDECWIGRDAEGHNVAEITWDRGGYVVDVTKYTYRTLRAAKLAATRRLY